MKKYNVALSIFAKKLVDNFNWVVLVLIMLFYGSVILFGRENIWTIYQFVNIFDGNIEPMFFGLLFIISPVTIIVGNIVKKNIVISIGLSIASFVWAMHSLLFLFAIPSNGVWVLSLLPLILSIRQGIKE